MTRLQEPRVRFSGFHDGFCLFFSEPVQKQYIFNSLYRLAQVKPGLWETPWCFFSPTHPILFSLQGSRLLFFCLADLVVSRYDLSVMQTLSNEGVTSSCGWKRFLGRKPPVLGRIPCIPPADLVSNALGSYQIPHRSWQPRPKRHR